MNVYLQPECRDYVVAFYKYFMHTLSPSSQSLKASNEFELGGNDNQFTFHRLNIDKTWKNLMWSFQYE